MTTALTVLIWVITIGVIIASFSALFLAYQINKTRKKAEQAMGDGFKKILDLNHPTTQQLIKKIGDADLDDLYDLKKNQNKMLESLKNRMSEIDKEKNKFGK